MNSNVLRVSASACLVALLSCTPPIGGGGGDNGGLQTGGGGATGTDPASGGGMDPGAIDGEVSGVFDPDHGLTLHAEGIELIVPAGAGPSSQTISMRPLSQADLLGTGLPAESGFDRGIEFLPSGTTFLDPVMVRVALTDAPAVETLIVLRYDDVSQTWGGTDVVADVSEDGTNATFELGGFSSYALWNPPLPTGDVAIEDGEIIAGSGLFNGQPFSVLPGYTGTSASLTYSSFGDAFALSLINVDLENPMTGDNITLTAGLHATEVRRLEQGVIVGLVTPLGGITGPSVYADGTSLVPKPVTGIMYLRKSATQWIVDVYCAYEGGIVFGQAVGDR